MGASQLISLGVFIFLTYRLDAATFGVFALGVIIIDYFHHQGRSAALDAIIQHQDFSPRSGSTAFWVCLGVVGVVLLASCVLGAVFAAAVDEPMLIAIMPVLALTLLPSALSIHPNAIMLRDHDFKGIALRGVIGTAAGAIAAIATIFSPFPEWALVSQRGAQTIVANAIIMTRIGWWPSWQFDRSVAAHFSGAAARIFAAQALAVSYMRVLDLVMGLGFGTAAVGFMRIANRFVELIYALLISPISSLWVLLLSEGIERASDRANMYCRLSQMSALIAVPAFGGLAMTGHDFIALALSDDYAPAAPMLVIFSVIGLLAPLTYWRNAAMIAVKRMNLLIAYSIFDLVLVFAAAMILKSVSPEAVVASLLLMEFIRMLLTVPLLLKDMATPLPRLIAAMMPAYLAGLIMALAVWTTGLALADFTLWIVLTAKVMIGAVSYMGVLALVWRDWLVEAISMLTGARFQAASPAAS